MNNSRSHESPQPELSREEHLAALAIQEDLLHSTRRREMRPATMDEHERARQFALAEIMLSPEERDRFNS